jgi:mono/diheme cytochrome c family protein
VSGRGRALILLLLAAVFAEAACLVFLFKRRTWQRAARDNPVQRGEVIAGAMGCFGCHGPGGAAPIANPGAKGSEVPGWVGGTWMMWNHDASDVRGWILDGHPAGRQPDPGALIAMPAYRSRLRADEADDLVAFVLAASHFGAIDDAAAAAGHETAYRLGCFGCHGPEGRGLVQNPGSFKGFIPPWDGDDFADLVRDDGELAEWVRKGMSARFAANPAARTILAKQAIKMPAYGDRVSDDDLRQLGAYVAWVRAHPRGVHEGSR